MKKCTSHMLRRWGIFFAVIFNYSLFFYLILTYVSLKRPPTAGTADIATAPLKKTAATAEPPRHQYRGCHAEQENGFTVVRDVAEIIRGITERQGELRKRERPRRVVLGMTFDCEEWMLEIKLNELGEVVDHFIVVEGAFTLQNTRREQCFPRLAKSNERIAMWSDKMVYVYDEKPIPDFEYWEAEVYYRDLIGLEGLRRLDGLAEDDLVVITDVDELPHASFLWVLKWYDGFRTTINLHMRWSYYSFGWMNSASWSVNAVVSVRDLALLGNKTNGVRLGQGLSSWTTGRRMLVGWHCSWCLPTERFTDKMAHFAHRELNQARFHDLEWLERMRRQGLWFPDAAPNGCVQSKPRLPQYVERNLDRFQILA